jgi:sodium-dependent dicarboxylate transporter 2/3/5
VGSLPNLVSIKALADHGIQFTFVGWMAYGLPASLILLIALMILLELRYPIASVCLKTLKHNLRAECADMPRASYEQWCAGIAFMSTIVLWLIPAVSAQLPYQIIPAFLTSIPVHTAAIVGVTMLYALVGARQGVSIINWKSVSSFDWGIVFLFAGGLCLGATLTAARLPELTFSYLGVSRESLQGLSQLPASVPLLLIALTIILSEICSNTVAAAILVPAVLEVFPGNVVFPVIIALGAGFGFVLPISTPPNALVYATGKVPLRHMLVTGLLFDCVGVVLLYLYYLVLR